MCEKREYKTQNHAFTGAISASRKTGKPMRAYRCHRCSKWHLTSQPKKEKS